MAPKKSKSQVKPPAKKKVVNKADPKKGLAGAGEPFSVFGDHHASDKANREYLRSLAGKPLGNWITWSPFSLGDLIPGSVREVPPLKVAIEKFSLSLVSEGMLAMVAMHGILSSLGQHPEIGYIQADPEKLAETSVSYARAVMAELKSQKDSAK